MFDFISSYILETNVESNDIFKLSGNSLSRSYMLWMCNNVIIFKVMMFCAYFISYFSSFVRIMSQFRQIYILYIHS